MPKYFKPILTRRTCLKNQKATDILFGLAKNMGYQIAKTPIIEKMNNLVSKYVSGEELRSEIYAINTNQDDMGLRYDLTLPLMLHKPGQTLKNYRRFELGRVFRNGPTKKDRYKQFIQADYDILNPSKQAIFEILYIMKKLADEMGIEYELIYNTRKAVDQAFEILNVPKKQQSKYFSALDKLEKKTIKQISCGDANFATTLFKIVEVLKKNCEKWECPTVKKLFGRSAIFWPCLARGQNWYNGRYWQLRIKNSKSSIFAGGEYEHDKTFGIGFSVGYLKYIELLKPRDKRYPVLVFGGTNLISLYEKISAQYKIYYVTPKNYRREFLKWASRAKKIFVYGPEESNDSCITLHFEKKKTKIKLENLSTLKV